MISASQCVAEKPANAYFIQLYKDAASRLLGMEGREHTAQVPVDLRRLREQDFREGRLPVLLASPTMELGVDIRDLNVVNMRNVPPTPANYAQRGGRAGRGGQPALVFTLCSEGSAHDQYFFRRQGRMVSGAVAPARLDLGNEELVRAHLHSVWFAAAGMDLKRGIGDVLDTDDPALPLQVDFQRRTVLSEETLGQVIGDFRAVLESCGHDLSSAPWFTDNWVSDTVRRAASEFDRAFDRWRELHKQAVSQRDEARRVMDRYAADRRARVERDAAERRHLEAMRQIALLLNLTDDWAESDFYAYRYLASEGFLPGYNFPRLPVRALVPYKDSLHAILRPRFLALSEFGPQNVVYHEGRKYRISRCVLPIGGVQGRLVTAKLCSACGYIHDGDRLDVDKCDYCGVDLDGAHSIYVNKLFEMSTVRGSRADRITCDEEERARRGYRITTQFRFAPGRDGRLLIEQASVMDEKNQPLMTIFHAPQATLWRVNHGRRRTEMDGFVLDPERGSWLNADRDESHSRRGVEPIHGIRPFVRDTRNLLLVQPILTASRPEERERFLATLGYALQRGIQVAFQVEEHEIAIERIGMDQDRRLLLWEASEGGSGVWFRLMEDPATLREVARTALEVCHFDATTGEDRKLGDCGRACYDCLLTYANQSDHALLDRHLVKDYLISLSGSSVQITGAQGSYDDRYADLRGLSDPRSGLERIFLDFLYQSRLRLPDRVQYRPEPDVYTEADFFYEGIRGSKGACVFCDGSVHDDLQRQGEDARQRGILEDLGYQVVVIRYDRDIEEQLRRYTDVFGLGANQYRTI